MKNESMKMKKNSLGGGVVVVVEAAEIKEKEMLQIYFDCIQELTTC
jgi:hypothetical protein